MIARKKFIFVHLCAGVRTKGVNHGIAYLIPIVKKRGYEVSIINIMEEISAGEFLKLIGEADPSIVGFSATSHQLKFLIHYSKLLEQYPRILQIAGGVHPTIDPENTLYRTALHGVCVGEGELPLDELLANMENGRGIHQTRGFYWRVSGSIKTNAIPQFVKDLSTLQYPDYSHFDRDFVVRLWDVDRNLVIRQSDKKKYIEVMLSRGCPYACTYCCNETLRGIFPSPEGYFRVPSVEYSIAYLQHLLQQYPETQYIEFIDDLLIANKAWFMHFAEEYKKKIKVPYRTNGRFECITEGIVKSLKDSGCVRMIFGLESGNEQVRSNILNRKHSNEFIVEKLSIVAKAGIDICTFNMIGLPLETKSQMEDTLRLNKKISPQFGICFFCHPYKGTGLYHICREHNLLKSEMEYLSIPTNSERPLIRLTGMSETECIFFHKKISFYFYSQTFKHRIRQVCRDHRGIGKMCVIWALFILFWQGCKLFYIDNFHKRLKFFFVNKLKRKVVSK